MLLRTFSFLLSFFIFHLAFGQDCPVFPHPKTYIPTSGEFNFGEMIAVSTKDLPADSKEYLSRYLSHELMVNALFVADGGDVLFKRLSNVPTDHYAIRVDKKITITYSSEASLFYAFQTIRQLVQENEGQKYIPCLTISDEPSFQYRGMHLDVSRHFFTVEEVKQYLDWMARYKYNTFHWHLTDDQGWRIEIKQYPKLTEIGSIRAQTLKGHASVEPAVYDGTEHKGYYTQKQIKEIVAYAAKLHIEVIPEIEMPGHARAALAAYPEYSCNGEKMPVAETWGVFEKVFCTKDETIIFLQNVLSEVVELFPGKYIHIGGDEAPKTSWKACGTCQAQMREHSLKNEEELQSFFIRQMDAFLQTKGKTLIGWDEILEGGLSENAIVMSWRGTKGGIEAAEQDHMVIMTPGSHCYFDHYQSNRRTEPLAIGGFTTLEKVYSYNPIPTELKGDKRGLILGAQANVWTEYMPDFDQVQYMILPRMVALSEVLWGQQTTYDEFLNRLKENEFKYYTAKEIPFSKAAFYLQSKIEPTEEGVKVSFYSGDRAAKIEGADPRAESVERLNATEFLFKPTEKLTKSNATATANSGQITDKLELEIWQHNTLGKAWNLETKPSTHYAGNGAFTLTDGIRGSRPWNGKDWLGFDHGSLEMELNLGGNKKVNTITVSCLNAPSSWIYLPETFTVFYSKNGKSWKEKTISVSQELTEIQVKKKTKYIKIKIKTMDLIPDGQNGAGHVPWLFLDEVWME